MAFLLEPTGFLLPTNGAAGLVIGSLGGCGLSVQVALPTVRPAFGLVLSIPHGLVGLPDLSFECAYSPQCFIPRRFQFRRFPRRLVELRPRLVELRPVFEEGLEHVLHSPELELEFLDPFGGVRPSGGCLSQRPGVAGVVLPLLLPPQLSVHLVHCAGSVPLGDGLCTGRSAP